MNKPLPNLELTPRARGHPGYRIYRGSQTLAALESRQLRGHRISRLCGFSLVEVLVAIAVLSVALVGLTQGITLALGSSKESELQTTAALVAAGMLETLRAEDELTDGVTDGDCGEGLELYRWQQTVTPSNVPGLHEVVVEVLNSRTGQSIYELRTLLFRPPEDSNRRNPRSPGRRGAG